MPYCFLQSLEIIVLYFYITIKADNGIYYASATSTPGTSNIRKPSLTYHDCLST